MVRHRFVHGVELYSLISSLISQINVTPLIANLSEPPIFPDDELFAFTPAGDA